MLPRKKLAPLSPQADLQSQILVLSVEEMEVLLAWLKATLKDRKQSNPKKADQKKANPKKANAEVDRQTTNPESPIPLKKGRELVETVSDGKVTYRLEKVKCGKKKCKCNQGTLHGPYWYAYSWDGKKLFSTYIGKTLKEFPASGEVPASDGVVASTKESIPSEG